MGNFYFDREAVHFHQLYQHLQHWTKMHNFSS